MIIKLVFLSCILSKLEVSGLAIKTNEPLIVTSLLDEGRYQEAQTASRVNYESFGNQESYSGYFEVEAETNSSLFFWFFKSENRVETDPVILCLQGGPGISSLLMLFLENGPLSIDVSGTISSRTHSWTKTNSILYIDSPVTVGFSVSENQNSTNLFKVTKHLVNAVKQFFKMFPNLSTNEFYIMGESYGGTYAPALANAIYRNNQNGQSSINLKGVCIGNGLTDTKYQTGHGEFLYQLGFINSDTKAYIIELERNKTVSINSGDWEAAEEAFLGINRLYIKKTGFENLYHILEPTSDISALESALNTYLNQEAVQSALHVGSNNFTAYQFVRLTDMVRPAGHLVEKLLNRNYKVLIYNGQLDFLIPYTSVVNYLKRLTFPGSVEYVNADKHIWKVGGTIAGYVKKAGNLYDVLVREAGHMAAMDQTEWVYDLVDRFVHNRDMWDST